MEELSGVGRGKGNVGDGEGWKVLGAEWKVFCGPATEDDALIPRSLGVRCDRFDGCGNQAHIVGRIIIGLKASSEERHDGEAPVSTTLMSSSTQMFSFVSGKARNSSRSCSLGMV